MSQLALDSVQVAIGQIGQQEHPIGSNWGEPVKTYLSSVDIDFPASWCMAFVYWCFDHAARASSIRNPLVRTAGVLNAWNKSNPGNRVLTNPIAGDIFIMDFGGGHGHTGIVEKADDTYIYTIEGNTNDTGSREGYEVCRRRRLKTSIKGYLRY